MAENVVAKTQKNCNNKMKTNAKKMHAMIDLSKMQIEAWKDPLRGFGGDDDRLLLR
jgi:hypothetical protein